MTKKYTCSLCEKTFFSKRTEKEAEAECEYLWDIKNASKNKKAEIVCEDCYGKMILKIQLPLAGNVQPNEVMMHNKDYSIYYQGEVDKDLIKEMDGEPKKFFFFGPPKKDGQIKILQEAPWQDW